MIISDKVLKLNLQSSPSIPLKSALCVYSYLRYSNVICLSFSHAHPLFTPLSFFFPPTYACACISSPHSSFVFVCTLSCHIIGSLVTHHLWEHSHKRSNMPNYTKGGWPFLANDKKGAMWPLRLLIFAFCPWPTVLPGLRLTTLIPCHIGHTGNKHLGIPYITLKHRFSIIQAVYYCPYLIVLIHSLVPLCILIVHPFQM